jgi:hypothetical protein
VIDELLMALEGSALARTMRTSTFLYPLANVLHVLGALTFFASVVAMDVVALRRGSIDPLRAFIRRVRPVAIAALLVQVVTGLLLLAPEASHIGHNPAFRLKVVAILLGLLNVCILELAIRRDPSDRIPAGARISAVLSVLFWLSTAAAGRLIAYF